MKYQGGMAEKHGVAFRAYVASDFEAVADLWTRVNRELAPAGMETLFEQYITTTIEGELSRLLDIFSQARRNAFWGSSWPTEADGSWARSASSLTTATRPSSGACISMRVGAAAA